MDTHPSEEVLAAWREGGLAEAESSAVVWHLARCELCRAACGGGMETAQMSSPLEGRARALVAAAFPGRDGATEAGPARVLRTGRLAAAAALLVGAGVVGAWILARDRVHPVTRGIWTAAGQEGGALGVGQTVDLPAGAGIRFDDGTEASCPGGASVRLDLPGPGVRLRLGLLAGEVRLEVPRHPGAVELSAGSCGVRVLGTRFRAAFEGTPEGTLAVVEVQTGRVELSSGGTVVVLGDGERAYGGEGVRAQRWVRVPASAGWAGRIASGLDALLGRDPVPPEAARWFLELREQGPHGIVEVRSRVADVSRAVPSRLRWASILSGFGDRAAVREAAEALAQAAESGEDPAAAEILAGAGWPHE